MRELGEEISIKSYAVLSLGYINEKSIDDVHFGLLYLIKVFTIDINSRDPEIISESLCFKKISELGQLIKEHNFSEWSKIALNALNQFIN